MKEEYTLQQAKDDMMKMWLWLSENPTKNKYNYLTTHHTIEFPFNCPLCLYVGRTNNVLNQETAARNERLCSLCPVKWSNVYDPWLPCLNSDSPFESWEHAKTKGLRKKCALEIYTLAKNIETGV